jgi:hypothetical protein
MYLDDLMKLLFEKEYEFRTAADSEIVRGIKEKFAYVALDCEAEIAALSTSADVEKVYDLQVEQPIKVGNEKFRAPEGRCSVMLFFQAETPCTLDSRIECSRNWLF